MKVLLLLAEVIRQSIACDPFDLNCRIDHFEIIFNESCDSDFPKKENLLLNLNLDSPKTQCTFRDIGTPGTQARGFKFNYTDCGTELDKITDESRYKYIATIGYTQKLDATSRIYDTENSYYQKFTCNVEKSLILSNVPGLEAPSAFVSAQVTVNIPEGLEVIKFRPPNSSVEILMAKGPDVKEPGDDDDDDDDGGVVVEPAENTTVVVSVAHDMSFRVPLQPEWWLQMVNVTDGEQNMEDEICGVVKSNWGKSSGNSTITNCTVILLEKIELNPAQNLIEQFPDLNKTLIGQYGKKIKERERRQAATGVDISDGLDVEVRLTVNSTSSKVVKAENETEEVQQLITETAVELQKEVVDIAWTQLMSAPESDLKDTVIFKQTKEEFDEHNKFEIGTVGEVTVMRIETPTTTEPPVTSKPVPPNKVWEFWWIPFMIIVLLLLTSGAFYLFYRQRTKRMKTRPLDPPID